MEKYVAAYVSMWTRFKDFSGKSDRLDYWGVVLINALVSAIFSAMGGAPLRIR